MKRAARYISIAVLAVLAGLGALWASATSGLPSANSLRAYRPPQATKVYSDDGHLLAYIGTERRTVVDTRGLPKHVRSAFLAAEDANFFEHRGLDYLGIVRAFFKNLRPGAHLQGASTITQQTVKTLLVGNERTYFRKIREAILARRLEEVFTKDQILDLYLNQVYFGGGVYGIAEASELYFRKTPVELSPGESAYLAAALKNPSKYTLLADPEAARERQHYVIQQMVAHGMLSAAEGKQELSRPAPKVFGTHPFLGSAPHYTEWIRRELPELLKVSTVSDAGFQVFTGAEAELQDYAHRALRASLEDLARRRPLRRTAIRIPEDRLTTTLTAVRPILDGYAGGERYWDFEAVTADDFRDLHRLAHRVRVVRASTPTQIVAPVIRLEPRRMEVDLGSRLAVASWPDHEWLGKTPSRDTPKRMAQGFHDLFEVGDLVRVEFDATGRAKELAAAVVPTPEAQAALVFIDPQTRLVRALVGGYDRDAGGFNRATQAKRQPGSAFKPIVYTAAIQNRVITPASQCADTPVTVRDPWTGEAWRPTNFERDSYDGNITYRMALSRSKNTCSVKLIEKLTPATVIEVARSMGISSPLPENLTLALGTGEVTVLELANSYATLAALGRFGVPRFVRKVLDVQGRTLYESPAELTEVLPAESTYVVVDMLRSVVEEGTAVRAQILERPIVGKTGTSQASRDLWFVGFTKTLAGAVWVGHDDNTPVEGFTGSSAALPLWVRVMGRALAGRETVEFVRPESLVVVRVDPQSGLPTDGEPAIDEVFLPGTEPTTANTELPSIFVEDIQ